MLGTEKRGQKGNKLENRHSLTTPRRSETNSEREKRERPRWWGYNTQREREDEMISVPHGGSLILCLSVLCKCSAVQVHFVLITSTWGKQEREGGREKGTRDEQGPISLSLALSLSRTLQ